VIELRNVFRIFATAEGDAAALQGLSLDVAEGEVVVVLGPSGSGKTTLLRILAGLDRPSAGTARVAGLDLGTSGERALARYRAELGYADQHYGRALAPELSARELVALQPRLAGLPRGVALERADELLERVGLANRGDAHPEELSGGEQQRVALCAAVAHRPRLLLADEPTGELDAANAAVIYDLLGRLVRRERCTTVVVSHDLESAAIADRIVHIRDGRVSEETARAAGRPESIVVGRGGWLRLPEELLRRSGIRTRATARLEGTSVVVSSPEPEPAEAPPSRTTATPARPSERNGNGTAVELRSLAKSFGREVVFDGLSATLPSGRFVVATGPSGSGKSTLLYLLAGLELPDAGEVVVLGQDLGRLDRTGRAEFRRERLGLVRQEPGLVPFLSARENVEAHLALRGVGRDRAADEAGRTLAAVGLAGLAEQRVGRLSTGERQRVAIARAAASRPSLLLADEPTARLDEANATAIGALLARLTEELGLTVIVATHDHVLVSQADERFEVGRERTSLAAP
jgi:ABC-type lipoprotein export system ATPase subunit